MIATRQYFLKWMLLWLILAASSRNEVVALGPGVENHLLKGNSFAGVLNAMLPNHFYFFEFPTDDALYGEHAAMCADGSPFSFMFRRGSDQHLKKLIVEFEGGPACWKSHEYRKGAGGCKCDKYARSTPWNEYVKKMVAPDLASPRLDSCTGIGPEYMKYVRTT